MSEHTGTLRVTIREAAERLGVTEGAVRKRIQRGSLPKEHGADGRVYVYLPVSRDSSHERSRTEPMSSPDPREELIVQLRSEVEAWREESRRKDTIIMNMTEAMKALNPPAQEEAVQEPPEAPETATPQPGRVEPQPAVEGTRGEDSSPLEAQETPEMHMPEVHGRPRTPSERPWWRRMFGA